MKMSRTCVGRIVLGTRAVINNLFLRLSRPPTSLSHTCSHKTKITTARRPYRIYSTGRNKRTCGFKHVCCFTSTEYLYCLINTVQHLSSYYKYTRAVPGKISPKILQILFDLPLENLFICLLYSEPGCKQYS